MDIQIIYLLYVLAFITGSIIGLVLSYKKYTEPFVRKNIDLVALILALIGWIITINYSLIEPLILYYATITVGIFLIAMVIGMRPGYGRFETVIGFAVAGIIWIIRTVLK
jgi:energy-converting hydrogenase A subunit L